MNDNDVPAAMSLLKDWSIWLVGLQTGALALITFFAGEDGASYFTGPLSFAFIVAAIVCFSGSTISATFLLGQLPSIRKRMSLSQNEALYIKPGNDFYQNPAWEKFPGNKLKLATLAAIQHWLFVIGIFSFGTALISTLISTLFNV